MKLTKEQLKQIIKEELEAVMELSQDPLQKGQKGLAHDVRGAVGRYLRKLEKHGKRPATITSNYVFDDLIAAFLKDPVGSKFADRIDLEDMKEIFKAEFYFEEPGYQDAYDIPWYTEREK
jgi:hypothetical protein